MSVEQRGPAHAAAARAARFPRGSVVLDSNEVRRRLRLASDPHGLRRRDPDRRGPAGSACVYAAPHYRTDD